MTSSGANNQSPFGAGDSALGYLYQIRAALQSSLSRIRDQQPFSVYLETLDDVTFEPTGTPLELFQLKHHKNTSGNLTDASPDIWKSLRVWMEGRGNGSIPTDARLFLVTTETAANTSIAGCLGTRNRDEAGALAALVSVASTSKNAGNEPAYKLFLALDYEGKSDLVSSIVVVPNSPTIGDVEAGIRHELAITVRQDHLDAFVSRLEGWWFRVCLKHLVAGSNHPILSEELLSQIDDLREQFRDDSLPVDEDLLESEMDMSAYDGAIFVHQARLAGVRESRVLAAVRDYYRAFEQRSRWVRENLLLVGELGKYERILCEEWKMMFDRTADAIGDMQAEDEMQKMAAAIYAWAETATIPIRPRVDNHSICRGSLHMLANQLRVGWHPEFMDRLKHLLEPAAVVA